MKQNLSPWIDQLNRTREVMHLADNREADVAIIGGGIAGISTAYFTLKNTDLKVFLVESDKVAHGATGHNAGQIVSYFERQISDLVNEFGIEMTAQAQAAIDGAWDLLEHICKDAKLTTPLAQFTGYAGCQDINELLVHLENNLDAHTANINMEPLMIAEETGIQSQIPEKYNWLYSVVPQADILSLLETEDTSYVAVICARKGVMNSALFCEELLDHIFVNFADRFTLFEESHVSDVILEADQARLKIRDFEIVSKKVVLCTNGFERFNITNTVGDDINTQFHHLVKGSVGYMAAYLEDHTKSPTAISYLPNGQKTGNATLDAIPYFYLTRRTYEIESNQKHSLICVGGPEVRIDDTNGYKKEHMYPSEAHVMIDNFLHKTYKHAPTGEIEYTYKWHGLMGYTPNGVRCIGPEPINPVLLYNLGCNGIGILPSIYGGKKISQFLSGEPLPPAIFDPQDSRVAKQD